MSKKTLAAMASLVARGITRDDVYGAAAALIADGTRPTVTAVRERLGTGSASTISVHLREWRAAQAGVATAAAKPASQIPESLATVATTAQETLQGALGEFWAAAESLATSRLSQEREAMQAELEQAQTERDDALELAETLDRDLSAAKNATANAVARFEQEKRRADFLENHIAEKLSSGLRDLGDLVRGEVEQACAERDEALELAETLKREPVEATAAPQ